MPRLSRIVGFLTISISVCALLSQAGGQEKKKDPPRPKNAVLDIAIFSIREKDTKDKVTGQPAKPFMVQLLEGNSYTIDVRSKTPNFDPRVRLEDDKGNELGSDDNSGGGVDAHL